MLKCQIFCCRDIHNKHFFYRTHPGYLLCCNCRLTTSVEELEKSVKSGDSLRIEESQREFVQNCRDPLADWLDKKYGSTVKENAIFTALPRYWEEQFHKDMDALNVS